MPRSLLVWSAVLAVAGSAVAQAPKPAPKPDAPKPDPSAELFKPGTVPKFKITVDADNLKQLRQKPREYVRCTVQVGDETFQDVGVHLKGAAGSYRDWDDRPALTLNFDKFKGGQKLKGLDKLHLNNSVQDGSVMHEILFSEMALALGVPTARAGHAIVELNGRKVGLYGLKEGYNAAFVQRHFPKATGGNLYDGGFLQDIDAELKLDDGPGNDRKDLKALVKASRNPDRPKRYDEVVKMVDADRFAADAALQILTCDWDGYMRQKNNYRVYFPPNDGKAVFIPHGKDQLLQNTREPLVPEWGGMVARALFNINPDGKKLYTDKLKEVAEKQFDLDKLTKRIDEWAKPTREALAAEDKNRAWGYDGEVKALKQRLKERCEFVKKELPKLK